MNLCSICNWEVSHSGEDTIQAWDFFLETIFAELLSGMVEVIDYVNIMSGAILSNWVSDYFPRLRCLCCGLGQAISSENVWEIGRINYVLVYIEWYALSGKDSLLPTSYTRIHPWKSELESPDTSTNGKYHSLDWGAVVLCCVGTNFLKGRRLPAWIWFIKFSWAPWSFWVCKPPALSV